MQLDHTIVPAYDKVKSAEFIARMFGLKYEGPWGHFAPVKVNDIRLCALERILQLDTKLGKVSHVPSDHRQPVYDGRRGDHGVLGNSVRPPVHEACPLSEGGRIHRKYSVGRQDLVQPNFQFLRLARSCSRVISIPACISPTVTADRKSCSAGTSAIQARIAPLGRGRRNSDTTLVSSRYMDLLQDQG